MKYVRWTAAHALFWTGHGVSKLLGTEAGDRVVYPIYNWLMVKSSIVQGPSDFGPWEVEVPTDCDEFNCRSCK